MRVNTVIRWTRRLALLRASTIGIIITSILSVSIALVTFYGDKIGNYVIGVSKDPEYGMSLYETLPDLTDLDKNATEHLYAPGLGDITNITYSNLPFTELYDYDGGSHNIRAATGTKQGMAFIYTFYLANRSTGPVPYNTTIKMDDWSSGTVTQSDVHIYQAVRIMLVVDSITEDTPRKEYIYSYPNEQGEPDDFTLNGYPNYTTEAWEDISKGLVCSNQGELNYGEVVKITIVMWLEGYDEQCIEGIKGGIVKFSTDFTVDRGRLSDD